LKAVARRANLLDPEDVKAYLARAEVSEARKEKLAGDLARFYGCMRIPFEKPRYRAVEHLPFIPLESEIDQLISAVGSKTATFLQLIKETACRPGEAWYLRWVDVDPERSAITITAEKHSKPRQFKASSKLLAMLNSLPKPCPLHGMHTANFKLRSCRRIEMENCSGERSLRGVASPPFGKEQCDHDCRHDDDDEKKLHVVVPPSGLDSVGPRHCQRPLREG